MAAPARPAVPPWCAPPGLLAPAVPAMPRPPPCPARPVEPPVDSASPRSPPVVMAAPLCPPSACAACPPVPLPPVFVPPSAFRPPVAGLLDSAPPEPPDATTFVPPPARCSLSDRADRAPQPSSRPSATVTHDTSQRLCTPTSHTLIGPESRMTGAGWSRPKTIPLISTSIRRAGPATAPGCAPCRDGAILRRGADRAHNEEATSMFEELEPAPRSR
jgi:hypothetical protein